MAQVAGPWRTLYQLLVRITLRIERLPQDVCMIVDAVLYDNKHQMAENIAGPEYCFHACSNLSQPVPDHVKNRLFESAEQTEGIKRYLTIFGPHAPTCFAPFVERVPLCKGRWDPDGSTATAYAWLVWVHGREPMAPFYIPPGCRKALTRPTDRQRFAPKSVSQSHGEHERSLQCGGAR